MDKETIDDMKATSSPDNKEEKDVPVVSDNEGESEELKGGAALKSNGKPQLTYPKNVFSGNPSTVQLEEKATKDMAKLRQSLQKSRDKYIKMRKSEQTNKYALSISGAVGTLATFSDKLSPEVVEHWTGLNVANKSARTTLQLASMAGGIVFGHQLFKDSQKIEDLRLGYQENREEFRSRSNAVLQAKYISTAMRENARGEEVYDTSVDVPDTMIDPEKVKLAAKKTVEAHIS